MCVIPNSFNLVIPSGVMAEGSAQRYMRPGFMVVRGDVVEEGRG